jgi:hypothetical protein
MGETPSGSRRQMTANRQGLMGEGSGDKWGVVPEVERGAAKFQCKLELSVGFALFVLFATIQQQACRFESKSSTKAPLYTSSAVAAGSRV